MQLRIPEGGLAVDGLAWPGRAVVMVTDRHWQAALLAAGATAPAAGKPPASSVPMPAPEAASGVAGSRRRRGVPDA